LLALLGQRKRFRGPPPPPGLSAEPVLPADPRPVLPAAARPFLLQLLTGRDGSGHDTVARAVFDRLEARGLRLHPFDLSRLGAYLKDLARARRLGPGEKAWLSLDARDADAVDARADEEISRDNWTTCSKAERIAFLEELRRDDPARARTLIESVFTGEPAPLRADMVRVLERQAGDPDLAFLEAALGDRARTVKDAARDVLSRIPGTDAYGERRAEALAAVGKKATGVLSGKPRLSFKIKGKKDPDWRAAEAQRVFDGIKLADIAAHLAVTPEALLPAAAGDYPLFTAFLSNAAAEGRWDLVSGAAGGKTAAEWDSIITTAGEALQGLATDRRRAVALEIAAQSGFRTAGSEGAWDELYEALRGPLDDGLADLLLASAGWRDLVDKLQKAKDSDPDHDMVPAIATLIPHARAERFAAAVEPLSHESKSRALLFHRFLATLPAET
jgi:hypothetical protein